MKVSVRTPSGIRLYYQDEPKRLYTVNGKWMPSVTTVLGVLDKPALPWWGMTIGVKGVLELTAKGLVEWEDLCAGGATDADWVVDLLKEHKLTVNHVRDAAGVRGVTVHDAFERFATEGELPNPNEYPAHEEGYVTGLLKFLTDAEPEPEESEVMVGSVEHGFAGRFDLIAKQGEREVVVRDSVRVKKDILSPGRYLYDLKTSKDVYYTHHLQLAGYEGAYRECGYGFTDYRAVIRVTANGTYKVTVSPPAWPQFLAVLGAYNAVQSLTRKGS